MKWGIKKLLRRFGLDIVRHEPDVGCAINLLELSVPGLLQESTDFHFVQVGASDGVRDDPLRRLVLKHGLKGLLVEPLPDAFAALQRNYADQPQLSFENAAISRSPGSMTIHHFREDAPISDEWHGMATVDGARFLQFAKSIGAETYAEAVTVPCMTIRELLEKHTLTSVDLLLIDTEGMDFEVLASTLEAGIRPTLIQFEFIHLPSDVRFQALRLLQNHGYGWVYNGIDVFAALSNVASPVALSAP
jgi:FkbM family methyltransferase